MKEIETSVTDIITRTPDIRSIRFSADSDMEFDAGQFFLLTINSRGTEMSKYFSFSNSPTENGYVEFTKRMTGSDFSKALKELKIGDPAKIKMPLGSFKLKEEYKKVAFISGGIGITPVRSICKFATDKKLPTDIVVLYGNKTEEDIVFRQDFDDMKKNNPNLRVVYTLTQESIDKGGWGGRRGYIDKGFIIEEIPDYEKRVFYICGPPAMVAHLVAVLKDELRVGDEKIRLENFTGY
ncbi:MAG: FAD-dependent oxidoreductase [Candidatus Omnitrophota bacterium]